MMRIHRLSLLASTILGLVVAVTITGPQAGVNSLTGQRPFRQDISSFQNSGPAFDLYMLALQQLAQQDQTVLLSYYQIAGIHGRPYVEWDGVRGRSRRGYCPHESVLFPSWHRPYLALFEVRSLPVLRM